MTYRWSIVHWSTMTPRLLKYVNSHKDHHFHSKLSPQEDKSAKKIENDPLGPYIHFDLIFQSAPIGMKITPMANWTTLNSLLRSRSKI